tara:strand:+ start:2127 stop:2606 length:480 start_codon:yes stop_codon:yes gene_type:complete
MNNHELIDPILKAYFAQILSGIKISKIVSEHRNEEELTPDSLISGLIYRLMIKMSDKEMVSSLKKAEKFFEEDSGDDNESEEDEDFGLLNGIMNDEDNLTIVKETKSRNIQKPTCKCKVCQKTKDCLIHFQDYETYDTLTTIFKDAIKKTCGSHKLKIL